MEWREIQRVALQPGQHEEGGLQGEGRRAPGTRRDDSIVVEELLGIQCRHAAGAGGGDGLTVNMVSHVARSKDTFEQLSAEQLKRIKSTQLALAKTGKFPAGATA